LYPYGIAVHANGTVYVADAGNRRVRAITPAGVTTTLAGSGANGSADGVGTAASFGQPSGLTLLGNALYVTDYTNNSIRQIDVSTRAVTTRLPSNALGPLGQPAAIAVDTLGNLIFMTHGGDTLNFLPVGSPSVQRLAGATSRVPNEFADGNGCDARFDDVEGLALSGRRLVMSDHYNLRARQATLP
jgi:YVTN family beta-propeller protein